MIEPVVEVNDLRLPALPVWDIDNVNKKIKSYQSSTTLRLCISWKSTGPNKVPSAAVSHRYHRILLEAHRPVRVALEYTVYNYKGDALIPQG